MGPHNHRSSSQSTLFLTIATGFAFRFLAPPPPGKPRPPGVTHLFRSFQPASAADAGEWGHDGRDAVDDDDDAAAAVASSSPAPLMATFRQRGLQAYSGLDDDVLALAAERAKGALHRFPLTAAQPLSL